MSKITPQHLYRPAPHQVPLDTDYPWVWSVKEQRWHLTSAPCRYAPTIDVWNRQYRDTTPPEQEMCFYCRRQYHEMLKRKQKELEQERAEKPTA
jgi:hypothetical protein